MGRLRVEELGDHRLLLRLINRWLVVHVHALVVVVWHHGIVAVVQIVVDDLCAIIVEFDIMLILIVAARVIEVLLFLIDLVRLTRIVLHHILIGCISFVGLGHVELHPVAVDLLGYADTAHLERAIEFALGLLDDWRATKVLHCHGRLITTVGA